MRKIVITMGIIFLLIIGLVSCSNDNHIDLSSGKYAVIYTDSTQRKSELVILDENGQIVSSENMKSRGIFQIETVNKEIILPALFDNILYKVDSHGNLVRSQVDGFTNYYHKEGIIEVAVYNTDLEVNTLAIMIENKVAGKLKLPSFVRLVAVDEGKIYAFVDHIKENKPFLYVIDTGNLIIEKRIELKYKTADDMVIAGNQLMLTTKGKLTTIALNNMEPYYASIPSENPVHFLKDNKYFYISTSDSRLIKMDHNMKLVDQYKIPQSIYHIHKDEKYFYILSQEDSSEIAATIGIYDKNNLEPLRKINLPNRGSMRVQNFILLED